MRALRCDLCGEVIGEMHGDDPTPAMRENIVARCYRCAATEEAEAITKSACSATEEADDGPG